jgi:hypothetical protein
MSTLTYPITLPVEHVKSTSNFPTLGRRTTLTYALETECTHVRRAVKFTTAGTEERKEPLSKIEGRGIGRDLVQMQASGIGTEGKPVPIKTA